MLYGLICRKDYCGSLLKHEACFRFPTIVLAGEPSSRSLKASVTPSSIESKPLKCPVHIRVITNTIYHVGRLRRTRPSASNHGTAEGLESLEAVWKRLAGHTEHQMKRVNSEQKIGQMRTSCVTLRGYVRASYRTANYLITIMTFVFCPLVDVKVVQSTLITFGHSSFPYFVRCFHINSFFLYRHIFIFLIYYCCSLSKQINN